jgi:DNA processing protein
MRNAVMSGMTLGTVIVEATHTSGTRVQARLALAQGRPVFLYSTLLRQAWARELARRPGVHVVEGSAQLVERLEHLTSPGELVGDGPPAWQ